MGKYRYGDKVEHFTGVEGQIAAITTRDKHQTYEMTYSVDGKPGFVTVEACEIKPAGGDKIGL